MIQLWSLSLSACTDGARLFSAFWRLRAPVSRLNLSLSAAHPLF